MEQHDPIRLYLDRDTTGRNYSRYALSVSNKYKDESGLYKSLIARCPLKNLLNAANLPARFSLCFHYNSVPG
jgi:hypothetical protein